MTKSKMTRILMIINIIVFVAMTLTGGSENIENLIRFNAMNKIMVYGGHEWWRLLTASFLHIGFMHLMMNMYFLNSIGPVFERLYGEKNYLIIYLLAGLMGNLLTYAFGDPHTVSAGASTSLYGLFGLALGIMLNYHNDEILSSFGASFITVIAINVIYSFLMPGIGILGHMGGLLGGFLLAGIFPIISRSLNPTTKILYLVIFIGLSLLFIIIGNKSMEGIVNF